ncbi:ABC transporter permease [Synechococcus sp. RSCCF101]|uniref:SufD family Fe-S cluster assembly protein n=1 Tax=Synechococcus sp. RSCCF101 TaxID=2511069 RepID=UPI001245FDDE|nr:SufD family Fe-S cluster assembly protein [Synechococcus sp. RSCCF101]QEY32979.1 ABC transporter permease [Synechococcus sp. RSCCF101]
MTLRLIESLPPASGPLAEVQRRGREALLDLPVPHSGLEPWRFTDVPRLKRLLETLSSPSGQAADDALPDAVVPPASPGTHRLILSGDGRPVSPGPLPDGLELLTDAEVHQALGHTLASTGCEHHWPVELNHAVASHCLALRVTGPVAPTLELITVSGGGALRAPRLLLLLGKGAHLSVLQVVIGRGAGLTSVVVEAHLGREARLDHSLLALGEAESALLADVAVEQDPGSVYRGVSALRGWGLARFEPRVTQVSGAAETVLRGLQVADADNEIDTHAQMQFGGPDGRLDQLHKALADDRGHSIFNGAVQVPRAAQRTDAAQLSRSLLLSSRARIDTKPQLEIVADDVRCTHGATVSSLRQEELFYLRSRGIDAATASRLLRRGYCQEILSDLPAAAAAWQPLERVLSAGSPITLPA